MDDLRYIADFINRLTLIATRNVENYDVVALQYTRLFAFSSVKIT